MISRNQSKEDSPNSYKHIHLKNINRINKQISENMSNKNIEYFPSGVRQQHVNLYLDISKGNTTNKQYSESSRYSKRQSSSTANYQQESRNMIKQNQKLKKEVTKLQKIILQKDDGQSSSKQLQIELVETYRVIHYYEGKLKQLQKICKQYQKQLESSDIKKAKSSKNTNIIEQLRMSNSDLRGKIQQKDMEINRITSDLRKLQYKFYRNEQKWGDFNKNALNPKVIAAKNKFIDDYQQNNLIVASVTKAPKIVRRQQLSKSKKLLRGGKGETDSQGSGASEYKSSIYTRRKNQEQSLRNSKHKSTVYGNINSKLNNLQIEVQNLKKQNQRLNDELDSKIQQLIKTKQKCKQLQNKNQSLQKIQNEGQLQLKKVILSKDKLKVIDDPTKGKGLNSSVSVQQNQNKLSMFVSNISKGSNISQNSNIRYDSASTVQSKKSGYQFKQIKQRTIRKLILNIVRQDLTYFTLIDKISEAWISQDNNSLQELLQQSPCSLTSKQFEQFKQEYNKELQSAHKDMNETEYKKYVSQQIKLILKDNISYFKNITIRRDFTLNIQLSNKFKNYENQLQDLIKRFNNKMPMNDGKNILIGKWGLTGQQYLFLQIKNYEQYDDIDYLHIENLGKYYLLE